VSRGWLEQLGDAIADLLFPPRCVACHRLGAWLCTSCVEEIEVIRPPLCPRCGLPLDDRSSEGAAQPGSSGSQSGLLTGHRCRETPSSLDGLNAYAFHSEPLRTAIHQFKYEDLRRLAVILGRLMGQSWVELSLADRDPDVIVPVPLHATRQRERGYNQAALLARELGIHLQRPVREDVLVRTKATAPQVDLNVQERHANVRGAFRVVTSGLAGKGVLLVDDVCTTGATLGAASSALREHDVAFVWAYTLARARPGSDQE
jgi:ComF family protein